MSNITVREYISQNGSSPFRDWVSKLDAQAISKVKTAKLRLEAGNTSNIKWFRGIGEYKINSGPGYRIYLIQEGQSLILLLGGGTKKRQQTDIKRAIRLLEEYKRRKKDDNDRE